MDLFWKWYKLSNGSVSGKEDKWNDGFLEITVWFCCHYLFILENNEKQKNPQNKITFTCITEDNPQIYQDKF